jgi:hypothetical protein
MNMYTKLSMHLSRHMYKRGAHKGDAPANSSRRGMSHFRVIKSPDGTMKVRMFHTDILTAHQDGSVLIDTRGYHTHNTTIMRLNEALSWFFDNVRVQMYKQSILSYSQPVLNVDGKRYSYYDGIILSETGEFLTQMRAFEQKRVNKAETKELADDLAKSGFTDAFKLLYAVATADDMETDNYGMFGVRLPDALSDTNRADQWKMIIARNKFVRADFSYASGTRVDKYVEKSDAKACWATIMAACKKNMYVVSRSETFVL